MRKNQLVLIITISLVSLLFLGCSYRGFIFGIPYGAKYDPEMSYIMGRFYMIGCFAGTIFIRLKNIDTGETYDIGFNAYVEKNVLIRAIIPGRYKIEEFFFRAGNQFGLARSSWLEGPWSFNISASGFNKFSHDFHIKKGSINYLGDFEGYCKKVDPDNLVKLLSGYQYFVWEIKSIIDNYDETKYEFDRLYINFKGIPIEKIFK